MRSCTSTLACRVSAGVDPDGKLSNPADEIGVEAFRRSHHNDVEIAGEYLLPKDPQLQIRQTVANTAMNAGSIGEMLAGLRAVDDEFVGALDYALVAIARHVPHNDLIASADMLAGELDIASRRSAHVNDRSLVAYCLRHEARHESGVALELRELARILREREEASRHRIACRVVSADDKQRQISNEFHLGH